MKSYENLVADESEYFVYSPSKTALDMFFYPLQCGHFFYLPGYYLYRDSFDSFLLMYIKTGRVRLDLPEQTLLATSGSFILLDCYSPHSYSTQNGSECYWCHFDGKLARCWYQAIITHLGNVITLPEPVAPLTKLTAIHDTFCAKLPICEALLSKNLSDILTLFLLSSPQKLSSTRHSSMIEEIISYITEHFSEDITLEQLAHMAGVSPYHFIRIFKSETGFTPHEYIINTRIASAKYLLKNSQLTVKDICFQTGFSCESVFCSAFKRHQNMTPMQYRSMEAE